MNKYLLFLFLMSVSVACTKEEIVKETIINQIVKDTLDSISVNLLSPTKDQVVSINQNFEFGSSTFGPVTKVEYYCDGSFIGASILSGYKFIWKPQDVDPGEHEIIVVAYPEHGKPSKDSTTIIIKVDLGDYFKGGRIFLVSSNGLHGLISSEKDLVRNGSPVFTWGPAETSNATDQADGLTNTTKMAEHASSPGQAGYWFKSPLMINGFNDWYIPSQFELELMILNQDYIGGFSTVTSQLYYWSSTEIDESTAFGDNFYALTGTSVPKENYAYRVRPIRKF
jgi:hypothetical protein